MLVQELHQLIKIKVYNNFNMLLKIATTGIRGNIFNFFLQDILYQE